MVALAEVLSVPGNIVGLLFSLALIVGSAVVAKLFSSVCKAPFSLAVSRKIIHIGVSNWYFIYLNYFDNLVFPLAGLLSFALINLYIELRHRRQGKGSTSWGTVEFPLIVSALVLEVFLGFGTKEMLGCALLGMGYGDGLAAVFGNILGKRKMPLSEKKTIIGSVVLFIVVSFIVFLIMRPSIWLCALIGLITMFVEAYTPYNLDNITVPVVIFALVKVLC